MDEGVMELARFEYSVGGRFHVRTEARSWDSTSAILRWEVKLEDPVRR